jgi:hypothetical protein
MKPDRVEIKLHAFLTSIADGASRAVLATCFHAGFLLNLFFNPEDGGDMFLRNVG